MTPDAVLDEADVAGAAVGKAARDAGVPVWLRSQGKLHLRFARAEGGDTRLLGRGEGGCLRVRVPRGGRGDPPEAIVVNTSGGLCGGDALEQVVEWGNGAQGLVTTQAAEKVYGSQSHETRIETRITAAGGARAHWFPQETILFDGARLRRDTHIDLASDARLLWAESLVFGRVARGERFATGALRDRVRIRRGGKLWHADVLDLGGGLSSGAALAAPALGNGAQASGMILVVHEECAAQLAPLRELLATLDGAQAGASFWRGLLSVRLLARDPERVRTGMARALEYLMGGAALPRVWRC